MRLLLVHNRYLQPGGEDAVFEAERALLARHGHKVVTLVEDNARLREVHPLKAAVEAFWSQRAYRQVRTLIERTRPQVVHVHNTFLRLSPAVYYAAHVAGVPVVQTLHNYRLLCPGALLMRAGQVCEDCLGKILPWPGVLRGCWRGSRAQTSVVAAMLAVHRGLRTWSTKVDRYIALTEFARQKFIAGGLPAEKIVVKPNFVDPDPGLGTHQGGFALFVGRLSAEKGLPTLLQAWKNLPAVPLKIIGDGPLEPEVRAFASRNSQVEVLGRRARDEVLQWMKMAQFLLFPSEWYEGFPMTLAEAFATGLPVIASRLGAMAEIVAHSRTGLLFEPGNPEALAEAVAWAWAHPKQMADMGREARREYEAKYTAERNYEMLMAIYRQVMRS